MKYSKQDKAPISKKVYNLATCQTGERTGESYECSTEGCNGLRIKVRWSGVYTYECTSRMVYQQRASTCKHRTGTVTPGVLSIEAGSWVISVRSRGMCRRRKTNAF